MADWVLMIQNRWIAPPEFCAFKSALLANRLNPFFGIYLEADLGLRDHIVSRLANLRRSGNRRLLPLSAETSLSPYFALSKEHGLLCSFSACGLLHSSAQGSSFFAEIDDKYLREEFLFLYILAFAQRCTLGEIAENVADGWLTNVSSLRDQDLEADLKNPEKKFQEIRESFLLFRARLYNTHPSLRDVPLFFYKRLHESLGIPALFNELHDAVSEMYDYLSNRRTDQFQSRINLIAAVFLVPSLLFSFLGINGLDLVSTKAAAFAEQWRFVRLWSTIAAGLLTLIGLLWFLRRK
jgi:hypothetical protein